MKRRTLLGRAIAALAAVASAGFFPKTAAAEDMEAEIGQLLLSIRLALAFHNNEGARQLALQLGPLSQRDPDWYTYSDSFQIAEILLALTPKSDRAEWIAALRAVVETFPGSADVNLTEGPRVVADACFLLLQAETESPTGVPPDQLGRAASLLLFLAGTVPGPERATWARAALRGIQRYGDQALNDWSGDGTTPRFVAAGVAMSGDWQSAASRYEQVLAAGIGTLDKTLGERPRSTIAGLSGTLAGVTTVESEAAAAFIMAGRDARGIQVLEQARRDTLGIRHTDPSGVRVKVPNTGVFLELQLVQTGTVVVQPVVSLLGSFVLVSVMRRGKITRSTAFNPEHGGLELFARLITSTTHSFTKDGLAPTYQRLRNSSARDLERKMQGYVVRAAADAEAFIGSTIRTALLNAKVGPGDDVLIVLPANLAILPISSARREGGGPALCEQFQLRYADSLFSACQAADRIPRLAAQPTSLAVLSSDTAKTGLAFVRFEIGCVAGEFDQSRRKAAADAGDARTILGSLDGATHWHIASHAAWNFSDPSRSGIAFGRGQGATPDDVLALQLKDPPRLVFLSACETALIDIKKNLSQFVGLPTAFLASGASGAIGSLWPVSDIATALLSARFYDEHIDQKRQPAAALKNAQAWLKSATPEALIGYVTDKVAHERASAEDAAPVADFLRALPAASQPFGDPYFWSGFQMYGR